ncbi:hypothetical protein GCM10025881_11340 [Pseudolysinimonas kribbensis]|uniref:Uncharacterized protein n=1 Tax=Pseudolysinimonas kribbensis TaxID=433641 RepID=A0ABQ6K422_9MICO|nr:hypothetical protein [Pseudolysinimonas kribbensis]GMA94310.1 hypothetical protein GCM10025881_11340 [Pseudolysinimonas kribbensis]
MTIPPPAPSGMPSRDRSHLREAGERVATPQHPIAGRNQVLEVEDRREIAPGARGARDAEAIEVHEVPGSIWRWWLITPAMRAPRRSVGRATWIASPPRATGSPQSSAAVAWEKKASGGASSR